MSSRNYSTVSHNKIMNFFAENSEKIVTAADIGNYLRNSGIEVNTSTVYRHLNRLCREGTVMKYVAEKGEMSTYQYAGDAGRNCRNHLHLRCTGCDRIIHLECEFMDELYAHIMNHHGFSLCCETSVLNGLCSECREKKA